jgi:hypothetical protein
LGSFGWETLGSCIDACYPESPFHTWQHVPGHRRAQPSARAIEEAGKRHVQAKFRGRGGVDPIPLDDILIVSTLEFDDPRWIADRRDHIGFNVNLLIGVFGSGNPFGFQLSQAIVMGPILGTVARFLARKMEAKTPVYIFFYCRAGRHRSVMCANIARYMLECPSEGLQAAFCFDNWTHLCEFYWRTVRCQRKGFGACPLCHERSYQGNPEAKQIILGLGKNFCHALTEAGVPNIDCTW